MDNSQQVAPPGEKPARRRAIPPALRGEYFPLFLSFVKRPVRTRMRGGVGFLLPTNSYRGSQPTV
jgi:hypothetical protein